MKKNKTLFLSLVFFFQRILFAIKFCGKEQIVLNSSVWPEWFGLGIGKVNFGDDLNVPLIEHLTSTQVRLYSTLLRKRGRENLLAIGSIIENFCNEDSVIWGSGAMFGNKPLLHKPKKVCSVRGPLTREYLTSQGIDCPEIYGDPALLFPMFYTPQIEKKYKLGIIPHYSDFNLPHIKDFRDFHPEILFIKLQNYVSWQDIINQICSCEYIVSSSLHGLILSDAYNIPNVRITCSDAIEGGDFKYKDYMMGGGREYQEPIDCKTSINLDTIFDKLEGYTPIQFDAKLLLEVFPYKK